MKFLFVVIVVCYFRAGSSISCYDCTSSNNSMCIDPTMYSPKMRDMYMRPVNCNNGVLDPGTQKFFCRKIIQTIIHKNRDSEVRVTRGCGWVRHHKDCYKADSPDHLETVCQCFYDGCNASAKVYGGAALVLSLISIVFFLKQ